MKKFLAVLLTAALTLSLVSCGNKETETENGASPIRVGIAAPDATHGWVAGVAYYAEKYCKENALVYNTITNSDAAEMQAALQDLAAWGADVIVAYPQWTGMETAFREVLDQNIPIVNFDVEVAVDGLYYVTGDNYDMGYQSAKFITEKVGEKAVIAVLDVPSSGSVSLLRKTGFYAYLEEIGYDTSNIFEVQEDDFSRDCGLKDMADVLEAHDRIDAVFSVDDELSIGVIQAIEEAGRTDIRAITGGGGCQEYFRMIADEKYKDMNLCSATYSPSMIQDAIELAIRLKNGETAEVKTVIPTTIVSSENVAEFLDPDNNIY